MATEAPRSGKGSEHEPSGRLKVPYFCTRSYLLNCSCARAGRFARARFRCSCDAFVAGSGRGALAARLFCQPASALGADPGSEARQYFLRRGRRTYDSRHALFQQSSRACYAFSGAGINFLSLHQL